MPAQTVEHIEVAGLLQNKENISKRGRNTFPPFIQEVTVMTTQVAFLPGGSQTVGMGADISKYHRQPERF
jgi:hypothetical protein